MSYVPVKDSYYQRSIGPYATPGWQFAPVPGWGKNTDFSARLNRVGVGDGPPAAAQAAGFVVVLTMSAMILAPLIIGGIVVYNLTKK
jgi:hypothetical protein